MIQHAGEFGYETAANLMAMSDRDGIGNRHGAGDDRTTRADTMVIVDNFGHLYREQVDFLYKKFAAAMEGTGKQIGFHGHNNMQLGFANTIEAIMLGANRVDARWADSGSARAIARWSCCSASCNGRHELRPVVELLQNTLNRCATTRWGAVAVQHHRAIESAPARRHQVPRRRRSQQLVRFFDETVDD